MDMSGAGNTDVRRIAWVLIIVGVLMFLVGSVFG